MNFGYPFTPYAANATQEQYMGNVGTTPNMMGMNTAGYMPAQNMGCGCGSNMMAQPLGQQFVQPGCNQVVEQMSAIDMPYYVNYNTHAMSNLCYIKWSKNDKKVPKSVQNGVFLDEN